MKISIIIPTYKPGTYVWECLDSLKRQTFDNSAFEILIILNGCNEPYYSRLKKYTGDELAAFHVDLIQTDRKGVSNARNVGLDRAKGDYIAFLDDDDYISPTYLQELYAIARTGVMPVSNILAFNEGDEGFVDYYISRLFRKIQSREFCSIMDVRSYLSIPVAKLLAAKDIGDRRFDTSFRNGEDSLFMLSISDRIKRVRPTSDKAVYYRRYRDNSAVTRKKTKAEIRKNKLRLARAFLPYLFQPFKYNFWFCLSRFVALFKERNDRRTSLL